MTWAEFVAEVEAAGVQKCDIVELIDAPVYPQSGELIVERYEHEGQWHVTVT